MALKINKQSLRDESHCDEMMFQLCFKCKAKERFHTFEEDEEEHRRWS